MGLFDIFKRKENNQNAGRIAPSVNENEKQYYQPDDYYTTVAFEGTMFEKEVKTFEQRKKLDIPTKKGLHVPEVLLLHYCTFGKYPNPANGYPGFWWFKYGIRDVKKMLESLEDRGFIQYGSVKNALEGLKVEELKEILATEGKPVTGKKAELIERIKTDVSDDVLKSKGLEAKYELTEIGTEELRENEYIPYMHNSSHKTLEDIGDKEFTVWSINRLIGNKDKSNWKEIVEKEYYRTMGLEPTKEIDTPETLKELQPRIPLSNIQNSNDWDKGFKIGFPYYEKGEAVRKEGKLVEAIAYYDKARAVGYNAPALYRSYAMVYRKLKEYDQEIEILEEAVARSKGENYEGSFDERLAKAKELKAKAENR